ncbi:hypothetical protein [Halosimplex halophilum]|uniref:hypothetical protein n=1 Tax=Halosimplex halophilum TaxID=2559572 RepID=UPI00107F4F93|nr:hypothetical protein [Halosimplex halophilum]
MTDNWYCLDCDRRIDPDDRSRHAAADHRLRGVPLPARQTSTAIRRPDPDETAIRPVRATETRLARRPGD